MTREEAIKQLSHCEAERYCSHFKQKHHCYGENNGKCNKREALDMAIEALSAESNCKDCKKRNNTTFFMDDEEEEQHIAIDALKADVARWSSWNKTFEQSGIADLISRADAIKAVAELWLSEASSESPYVNDDDIGAYRKLAEELFADIPSAEAARVAYICDGRKCDNDCSECFRTTDVEHAKHFTRLGDAYMELPSADRPQGFRGGKIPPKVNHIEIKVNDRPQGEWVIRENGNKECSLCGHERQDGWDYFCGYCGAEMEATK